MRRAAVLIALTGCDLVFPPGGGPGAGTVDANGDVDGPPGDADLGHNEDGDAFPDLVDYCPHQATASNVDSDGDGVGDPCDAEPTLPNQARLYFNSFAEGFDALVMTGDGALAGDQLAVQSLGGISTVFLPAVVGDVEVFTHVRVDDVSSAMFVDVEAIAGHVGPGSDIDGVSCRIGRDSTLPGEVYYQLHQRQVSGADSTLNGTTTSGILLGVDADVHFIARVSDNSLDCYYEGTQLHDNPAMPVAQGSVGLGIRRANVRFDYLFLVGRSE